jgi:HK97 family phage major capsid protein/HK97 family phage prohead protease
MNRAYSILNIKSVDDERRQISGIATTPTPDRLGDIIQPLGVEFKNPMPLLWQHKSEKPVGQVVFKKPTKEGIEFNAQISHTEGVRSTTLRDRLDEAWDSVKMGLVKAVSIGFRPVKYAFMDDGGVDFQETEVMELSLVTIPANAEATILQIKNADRSFLMTSAAPGTAEFKPGVTGGNVAALREQTTKPRKDTKMPKTIAEQISAFEATRAAKFARMTTLMDESGEKGETLGDAEAEEYKTAETDVRNIDEHLVRLHSQEKLVKEAAKPVQAVDEEKKTSDGVHSNGRIVRAQVMKPDLPKGTAFTRYAMAVAASKGNRWEAQNLAKQWKDQTPEVALVLEHDIPTLMRAAVGVGTTIDATWASPLIAYTVMASEFAELLRPATIIGRIPGLRNVPFNIQLPRTTTGTTVGWVGENAPKPVSQMAFDTVTLRWAKAAGIVVLTDELVRFSNPSAEAVVRADLIAAMAQFLDRQFVDPAVAEVTNVSPASITNGVTPTTASGTTATLFRADVKTMFATFLSNNLQSAGGVWIMTQQQALALSLMMNSLGQPVFPSITVSGGTLLGYPVIASENLPATGGSPADGYPIIFLVPNEIMLADDGQVIIDASNQASVQMDTAPDSPPTASTALISLWQMNFTALRAERWINWKKRRSTAVAFIQNAKYSE